MSKTDTSAETVERRIHECDLAAGALRRSPTVKHILQDASNALRALVAERDALRAQLAEAREVESLLDTMTQHHLPLQVYRERDGLWVLVDASTDYVLGSGETVLCAIRALKKGGDA